MSMDKRRAVLRLLEDEEWSAWSDREIARRCAVGATMVNALRADICPKSADSPAPRKVERNGTTYTQDTSRIGKRPEPIEEPEPRDERPTGKPEALGELAT